MKNHYEKNYHEVVHGNLLKNGKYYLFRAKCSQKYWKYLRGNVLEFGCGLGQNIFLNKEKSVGVDVSEFCIDKCKERGIKVFKNLKDVKAKIDSILCVHVLEHLRNPDAILNEFYNSLEKGGTLVLVLPEFSKNIVYKSFKPNIGKHLYGWNFGYINELLHLNGFNVVKNQFNYGGGYSMFYKYPFGESLVKGFGKLMKKREMIIVAKKN
ncbi:MAG: hypothetical protein CMH64_00130 [Nanoarchaeota archaeon]|nr:hypothetical protein [Nanoarchaeota archaeon]